MGWLRFNLPLEEELAVETSVRAIRDCSDLEALRALAEQSYRAWATQVDITSQLIAQLAEAEANMAQAGLMPEPDPNYLKWARELSL
jgi:hypothetical protein